MTDLPVLNWAPEACTLPTVERPLRVAEFHDLFRTAVRGVERVSPVLGRVTLASDAGDVARDLARRETECCSFFDFTFADNADDLVMEIGVPVQHAAVLEALLTSAEHARHD